MNREFKFPVSPPAQEPPQQPPVPRRDSDKAPASPPAGENLAEPESEEEELTSVGMVAPSTIEVHPPPPIEKEKAGNVADDGEEDVGPTEEISLN
jgi:chitin biosynthesis protein CHS5